MPNDFYNPQLKNFSRELRSESVSKAEKLIWKSLLSRKQMGVSFKRQRPIGNFIVDFFSAELKLIIEIDGSSHLSKGNYDFYREKKLKDLGCEIVRFKEVEIIHNLDEVYTQLMHVIHSLKT